MTERTAGIGRPPPRDAAILVVALLAVSTSGPLIAATAVVPALAIAFWRNGMAAAVLLPAVLLRRRTEFSRLSRREWRLVLLAGLMLALHFGTWIPSISYTSVASATALVATQPVWAALIARVRGAVVPPRVWVGIAVSLTGALLLTGADIRISGDALLGDALALLGGVFAAAYVTTGSEVRRSVTTTTYTALCYTTTAVLLLGVCLVGHRQLTGYPRSDWVKLVALTLGAQLLGHTLFNVVLKTTSPTVVSLSILFEIPGAAVIAALFVAGQELSLVALPAVLLLIAGLAIVISGTRGESLPVE